MSANWQNASGTIPAGGSVVVMPADINRNGAFFMNPDATHAMTVTIGAIAIPVPAGQSLTLPPGDLDAKWCPSNAITISGTATSNYVAAHF